MTDRELLQQALEALEQIKQETFHPAKVFAHNHAITALRERLAQPNTIANSEAIPEQISEPQHTKKYVSHIECQRCGRMIA